MPNHYNYSYDSLTNTYNFITKNEIIYRIAFIEDESLSAISGEKIQNVFQLVIEKANSETEPFDIKVSKTVESIIERFFEKFENALIYICADNDGKAIQRFKIFNRWYENSPYKTLISKHDNILNFNIIDGTYQTIYTSVLMHKRHPHIHKIISIFNNIEASLNSEKPENQ